MKYLTCCSLKIEKKRTNLYSDLDQKYLLSKDKDDMLHKSYSSSPVEKTYPSMGAPITSPCSTRFLFLECVGVVSDEPEFKWY